MSVAKGNVVCYHGGLSFQKRIEIEMNFYNIWVFPKNRGNPKWMVYDGTSIKMDDFGGTMIFGNTHIQKCSMKSTSSNSH